MHSEYFEISFVTQLDRLKTITGQQTDAGLAAFLAISESEIIAAREHNKIPAEWLITLLRVKNANPEWILSGAGPWFLPRHREAGQYETGDEAAERAVDWAALRCLPSHVLAEELLRRIAVAQSRACCRDTENCAVEEQP